MKRATRAAQIAKVLLHHGFADIVDRSGISSLIEGGLEKLGKTKPEEAKEKLPAAVRLRMVLEELGTTFIKLGQILSTRPDMIPPDILSEFQKLQSDTPKAEFSEIRKRLEGACPEGVEKVFREIDEEPLASASIAQVHHAVLADGTPVVVKVLRPGVEEVVRGDIVLMRDFAIVADGLQNKMGFSPREVVNEFARMIEDELDFEREGKSTEKLSALFADVPEVNFPEVHWEGTSKSVLALEEIKGVQVSKLAQADLAPEIREHACANGAMAVFRMCLEFGFFHADPHPGNIFIKPDGSVVFIDCGMTAHVEKRTRFQLGQFVRAVLDGDLERTTRLAIDLSNADPSLESDPAFRKDIWELVTRFETSSVAGLDIVALLDDLSRVLRKYHIRCPAGLVHLIKALATVQGVAGMIDPNFDVMECVRPLMTRLVAEHYGVRAVKERLTRSLGGYTEILEESHQDIRAMITKLRRDNYEFSLRHRGLENLRDAVLNAGRFVAMAMILSATLLSSAVLVLSKSSAEEKGLLGRVGEVAFLGALAFVVFLGIGALRRRRK